MTSRGHASEPQISATDLPDDDVTEEAWWDTGSIADAVADALKESDESGRAYLRESWLAATMGLLRECRRRAGLTQVDIADLMGTKQPAIARLERADDTTLGRFWDYLSACGLAPLEIEAVPVSALRRYALADVDAPRTASEVNRWLHGEEEARPILPGTGKADSYQWLTVSPHLLDEAAESIQRARYYFEDARSLWETPVFSGRDVSVWSTNIVVTLTSEYPDRAISTTGRAEKFAASATDRSLASDPAASSKSQGTAPEVGSRAVNERVAA